MQYHNTFKKLACFMKMPSYKNVFFKRSSFLKKYTLKLVDVLIDKTGVFGERIIDENLNCLAQIGDNY